MGKLVAMVEIGGYRLLRRLGAGGMGAVHEALDADGRNVAIKVLHPHISADPAARARLRREVALLHRVRHPAVARVLDAEADGVEAFIVTELIPGVTLDDRVRDHGPLGEAQLRELAHGLHEGLTAIHRAGIVHRDLKPGNVMLAPQGPIIIDFGIAQVADDARLTQTGMVTGTAGYLAPEVLEGVEPGPGGDWWAWAAVLTFAASGHPPFGSGPIPAVLARVSSGLLDTTGLGPDAARLFRAALHPDPARRPSPASILDVLDGVADVDAVLPPPPSVPPGRPTPDEPAPRPTAPYPPGVIHPAPRGDTRALTVPEAGHVVPHHPPLLPPAPVPAWARPLPRYRLLPALLGLALAGIAAFAPGPWLVVMAVAVTLLGTIGVGWRRLYAARQRRGPRRSDAARTAAAAPWHVVVAVALAIPGLALAAALGMGALWLTSDADAGVRGLILWLTAVICGTCLWLVPSSAAARDGARAVLRGLRREGRIALLLTAVIAIALLAALVLTEPDPAPTWWPLPQPPSWGP